MACFAISSAFSLPIVPLCAKTCFNLVLFFCVLSIVLISSIIGCLLNGVSNAWRLERLSVYRFINLVSMLSLHFRALSIANSRYRC